MCPPLLGNRVKENGHGETKSVSRWLALVVVFAATASRAGAQAVTIDFLNKGTVSTANFRESTLAATPELQPPVMRLTQFNGLGMVGGTFDSSIDAGESVLFTLDLPATGVSYFVQFAQDSDGDGQFGETEVEGYGADGVWLGTVTLADIGSRDISAAFAGQPLTAVRVRPSEAMRIYSLSYNSGAPVTVAFHDKSTTSTARFRATGLTVTPELQRAPDALYGVQRSRRGGRDARFRRSTRASRCCSPWTCRRPACPTSCSSPRTRMATVSLARRRWKATGRVGSGWGRWRWPVSAPETSRRRSPASR